MWPTSKGVRALDGAEALLVRAIRHLWEQLEIALRLPDQQWTSSVRVFDMLECDQKIVQLSIIAWELLCNDAPAPSSNAMNEGTVAVIFDTISVCIASEIQRGVTRTDYDWRGLVHTAIPLRQGPGLNAFGVRSKDIAQWTTLLKRLSSDLLWHNAWADDGFIIDADPVTADVRKERLGIDEDYFLAVPPRAGFKTLLK